MPECDRCGASFDDEDGYLDHLASEHADDLGAIEQRRVDARAGTDETGIPLGPTVLGVVLLIGLVIVIYLVVFFEPGGAPPDATQTPGPMRSAHDHGTINVTILGDRVDFSQRRYQLRADRFHFEQRNGRVWHAHATGVTLEWAMKTLGINVTRDSVTFQGTTYRDGQGYDVSVTVDGESVDPATYVLQGARMENAGQGDHVRIVVCNE